jgi:putative tryptophan/tyrosine transport system substrate-binding protein
MRRLWLGLTLIAAAAAILLISDRQQRRPLLAAGSVKSWKIGLLQLNNVLDVEETEEGIFRGLNESGLVKGRDYDVVIRNAQGDMATLNALVDAALADGSDMLLTLSTPTLQTAIQRSGGRVPIVFTYVSNAFIAGAGTTNENHLPNVTGVPMVAAYPEMLSALKQVLPNVRRIGTLFVPSEVNMVFNKDLLVQTATAQGLEVETVGVATSSEVPDATLALLAKKIDALVQIPGNMTAAAFGGIAQSAQRAHKPIFGFQKVQATQGASVVFARDYADAGREAAHMAVRIMRGEHPANMPFLNLDTVRLIVNPAAAAAVGMSLPGALVGRADEVLREALAGSK